MLSSGFEMKRMEEEVKWYHFLIKESGSSTERDGLEEGVGSLKKEEKFWNSFCGK